MALHNEHYQVEVMWFLSFDKNKKQTKKPQQQQTHLTVLKMNDQQTFPDVCINNIITICLKI